MLFRSFDTVFVGPLSNYLQETDCVIAISSSGNSPNIVKAVEYSRSMNVPVIGLSGFDGGKLNELANAKILINTSYGEYTIVESIHNMIMHLLTSYFQDYFDYIVERGDL